MSVTVNGSTGLTFNDGTSQSTSAFYGGLALRNRIINGAMMIDQRNAGTSVTQSASLTYGLDRWFMAGGNAGKFTVQQSTTAPSNYKNSMLITSTSAYSVGSGDLYVVGQSIEGLNVSDFGWGTASATPITISFWVRSSLTGTFGGSVGNAGWLSNTRSYPFSYTISAANTWEQKTITIAGDTSGTWATSNAVGLTLFIGLGVGSSSSGTAGAWASANYIAPTGATSVVGTNGATFYITGVQLEKGSTATSFDYRPYGTELALCQRYYYNHVNVNARYFSLSFYYSSSYLFGFVNFPVTMRTAPTLVAASGTNFYNNIRNGAADSFDSLGIDSPTTTCSAVYNSTEVSGTAGQAGIIATNNASASVSFSAEL